MNVETRLSPQIEEGASILILPEEGDLFATKEARPDLGGKVTIRLEKNGRQSVVAFWNQLEETCGTDMDTLRSRAYEVFDFYKNQDLTESQQHFLFVAKKSVETRLQNRERFRLKDELLSAASPWKSVIPLIKEKILSHMPGIADYVISGWIIGLKRRLPQQVQVEFDQLNQLFGTNNKVTEQDIIREEMSWAYLIRSKLENLDEATLRWIKADGLKVLLLHQEVPEAYQIKVEETPAEIRLENIPEPEEVLPARIAHTQRHKNPFLTLRTALSSLLL